MTNVVNSKVDKKRAVGAKTICFTALMMAVTLIFTAVVEIPIPLGYANLGSTMILLGAYFLGWGPGLISGALAPALADFLLGFPYWCLPTIVVKGGMVVFYLLIARSGKKVSAKLIIATIVANVWAAFGYTAFGALIYGSLAAGLASTPGLLMESAINAVLFIVLVKVISGSKRFKYIDKIQ